MKIIAIVVQDNKYSKSKNVIKGQKKRENWMFCGNCESQATYSQYFKASQYLLAFALFYTREHHKINQIKQHSYLQKKQ